MPKKLRSLRKKHSSLEENYGSPRWSYQILESRMPLSFDQYDHCSFNCKYCLAYFQKALKCINPLFHNEKKNYRQLEPRSINLRKFQKLMRGDSPKSQFADYVKNRFPLEWGGLADPFCYIEDKHQIGLRILETLDELNYPTSFSTKGINFVYNNDYMELFERNDNWRMQFSIINLNEKRAKLVESGVSTPQARLDAMDEFNRRTGRSATLRLRPFIIGFTDRDNEHLALIEEAAKRGCKRVSMEFFCLERRLSPGVVDRYDDISEAVGFDIIDYYTENSPNTSGYLRLNWKIKAEIVTKILKTCKKLGMTFYASDSMVKDMSRQFGNSPDMKGDYQRGQFSEAMQIAMKRKDKKVYWQDIEPFCKKVGLDKFLWRYSEGYNTGGTRLRCKRWNQTMLDFIKENWNSPNGKHSPYQHFYGVLMPIELDNEGNVVYQYQPRKGVEYVR